jgi:Domain of unknown function (DUF4412)
VTRTLKTAPLVAALCLLAWPLQAADGILIVEKTTTGGTTRTNQIQIEKNRLRAENDTARGKQIIVFDGVAQVLRTINPDAKTYSEMTKADVDRVGGQMQDAMAQMQEQMKNMPPAARAQMEAMMRGRGMPAAPAKTEYRKTGTDRVGKWTCDKYEGFQGDQKVSEICTVDPKVLGFAAADFDVTRQMGAFFQQMLPQQANQMFTIGQAETQGFSGIPVRRTSTIANVQTTTELTDVTRQNFPDASYAVPAGFQKQEGLFGAPAGRGRRGRD